MTTALLAATAGALALAAATPAAVPPSGAGAPARDAPLWATVNVCDTTGYPDGVGIRASMPGSGDRRETMFVRLEVLFLRAADGRWMRAGRAGDSGFIELGNAAVRGRQVGRTFTVTPPAQGRPAFLMRGLATYEWRRDGIVVRRARRLTTAGHPGTPGADPPDFSSATCSVV
jgi:hypothetical protein